MITLLVTGGRHYSDDAKVNAVLSRLLRDNPELRLVHGGCGDDADQPKHAYQGADGLAHAWARALKVPTTVYPARWTVLGKPAGPERNARMLKNEPVSIAVAFAGGKGTANMVSLLRQYGIPIIMVS